MNRKKWLWRDRTRQFARWCLCKSFGCNRVVTSSQNRSNDKKKFWWTMGMESIADKWSRRWTQRKTWKRTPKRPTNLEEGEESVGIDVAGLRVGPQKPVDLASNLLESSLVGIAFFQKVAHHRQQRLRTELISVQILVDLIEAHADPSLKHRLHFHQLHLHQESHKTSLKFNIFLILIRSNEMPHSHILWT